MNDFFVFPTTVGRRPSRAPVNVYFFRHTAFCLFSLFLALLYSSPIFTQSSTEQRIDYWRNTLLPGHWQAVADSCANVLSALPKGQHPELRALALSLQGSAFRQGAQWEAALAAHRQALSIRQHVLGPGHPETANSLQNIGNCLLDMGQATNALQYLKQAASVKEQRFGAGHPRLIPVYTALGQCYRMLDKRPAAEDYLRRAWRITEGSYGSKSPYLINILYGVAGMLTERNEPDSAFRVLLRAYRLQLDSVGERHRTTITLLSALGKASTLAGRPTEGTAYMQEALQLYDQLPGLPASLRGECLLHLGNSLLDNGDFAAAETALRSARPFCDGQPELEAAVLNSLGLALRHRAATPDALAEITRAVNLFLQSPGSITARRDAAGALQNLGSCFFDLGDWAAARYYYEQAEQQLVRLPNTEAERAACLGKTARCLLETGDFAGAKRLFEQASRIVPARQRAIRFALLLQLGDWHFKQRQHDAAVVAYHQALNLIAPAGPLKIVPYPYELLQGRVAMATVRRAIATKSGQTADWVQALNNAQDALDVMQEVKTQLQTEISAIELFQLFDTPYDLAVEACLALGQTRRAWQYADACKSNFLQKLDEQARNLSNFGLPADLARQEREYWRQLNIFQKRRNQLSAETGPAQDKIAAVDDSLRRLSEASYRLRQTLTKRYPDYYRWLYGQDMTEPDQVRRCLRPGQCLLSYHWADDVLYAFVLSADSLIVRLIQAPAAGTARQIEQYLDACSIPPASVPENERSAVFSNFRSTGLSLYRLLVQPVEPLLQEDVLIAPDAALCLLPFEALLVSAGAGAHRFDLDTFLLQKHRIGYVQSAAALVLLHGRTVAPPNGLLAFAPDFQNNRHGLKTLRHNVDEIDRVYEVTHAERRSAQRANKQVFLNEAPLFGVLLLSTHGVLNDRMPTASFVAFTEPTGSAGDGLLTVAEIFNLDLHAELIVLSACQTASGALYRGEGMQSIARAFQYAGARSLVASRWNVDDKRMPYLVQYFFENLWEGQTKSGALAQARRRYLAGVQGFDAHPYFWAGLVSSGDDSPLPGSVRHAGQWYWWMAAFVVAMAIAAWQIRRKTRLNRNRIN